jgi:mevalonate kinase
MNWLIPSKTFLLGEYAALSDASALLITTTPCFELHLTSDKESKGIHYQSPAGIWWNQQKPSGKSLSWHDPYKGLGGLGASSAQFLGSYLADCFIKNKKFNLNELLAAYYHTSWNGTGLKPSGYDIIAQSQQGCVYINKQKKIIKSYKWLFRDLSFFLIRTGVKLPTHHHLQETELPNCIDELSFLAEEAKDAFEETDSKKFIWTINQYHQKLSKLNLVAEHSQMLINQLKKYPEVLAIKGCGALGADVLLLLTTNTTAPLLQEKLNTHNLTIIATNKNIYLQNTINKNKKEIKNTKIEET